MNCSAWLSVTVELLEMVMNTYVVTVIMGDGPEREGEPVLMM